jgi:hypothetical protein
MISSALEIRPLCTLPAGRDETPQLVGLRGRAGLAPNASV